MKIVLSLAFAVLTLGSFAQASQQAVCAFGQVSWDLKEVLEQDVDGKMWYQSEHISIDTEQRLQGLSATEKDLVVMASLYDSSEQGAEQTLKDFYISDGYLTYFHDRTGLRHFVIVASYPGDNEFGAIFEITPAPRGSNDIKVLKKVADVVDGDLEECSVTK